MRVYYAHCKAIYGTPQEERDIELLEVLGFEVVNPNDAKLDALYKEFKLRRPDDDPMFFWRLQVHDCDALAFRALPGGELPAGVLAEIEQARHEKKPVFELPTFYNRRKLTVEETRAYLAEIGER